jgi:hypothetical protein
LASGLASIQKGTIPPTGLTIEADHHKVDLQVDNKGRISGSLESKVTEDSSFKVDVKNGRVVSGTFQHVGAKHTTTVSVGKDNWKAEVASGGWSIKVDKGKATKISGNLEARF